jgi:hypothetical protein
MSRFLFSRRFEVGCAAFVMLAAIGLDSGCKRASVAVHPLAPELAGDSIQLITVRQEDGQTLQRGKPTRLIVRVAYGLASRDTAVLALGLDQFPDRTSCVPAKSDADNVGTVASVAEVRIPIQRGSHVVEVPITWPGDTGVGTQERIFNQGTISLHASMWSDEPEYKFLMTWFGTEYCERF